MFLDLHDGVFTAQAVYCASMCASAPLHLVMPLSQCTSIAESAAICRSGVVSTHASAPVQRLDAVRDPAESALRSLCSPS
jgi:hypothetical protein